MNSEKIIIKLKCDNKVYNADSGNLELVPGNEVLFDYDQGQDVATVVTKQLIEDEGIRIEDDQVVTIIRKLNVKDKEKIRELEVEAKSTIARCQEKIEKFGLQMELVNANLSFDGKKLTFYFVAPGRVDFRSLVSDLASSFQKLIRLQQVGSRDKARCTGGYGRCGQELCCKKFLKGELESVTMDMAYDQGLAQMGSNRVTGSCGKLMCCLKYELDTYKKAKKKMPAVGDKIKTKEGMGVVVSQSVVKNLVKVKLDNNQFLEVSC